MRTRIPGVMQAVSAMPWAIVPEKLNAILDMLELRASGVAKSDEEMKAVMGARARSSEVAPAGSKIAVLQLYGVVCQRANMMTEYSGGTSTEQFASLFDSAVNNPEIGAIVIDCDSPGGSVSGVTELFARIMAARGKKKIVAVANTLMASAAYWICCAADEIVVTPSGDVGSIGVFMCHTDVSEADEKEGIKRTLISAGKYKTEGNPYEPLSPDALASIQSSVDEFYSMFTADVARGRGMKVKDVQNGMGEGRVLPARQSVAAGLADRVATLEDILAELGAPKAGANGRSRRAKARPLRLAASALAAELETELMTAAAIDLRALNLLAAPAPADDDEEDDEGDDLEENDELEDDDDAPIAGDDDDDEEATTAVEDDDDVDDHDDSDATTRKKRRGHARAFTVSAGGAAASRTSSPATHRPLATDTEQTVNTPTAAQPGAGVTDAIAQERSRVSEIMALCALHGCSDLAQGFIDSGASKLEASARILETKRTQQAASGTQISVGDDRSADRKFANAGEQLFAIIQAGRGNVDPRLKRVNHQAMQVDRAGFADMMAGSPSGMNESVSSEGGFFIAPEVLPGIMEPIYSEDPILSRVTRIPIGSSTNRTVYNVVDETARTDGNRWGGIQMFWGDEADTATAKKPKMRQVEQLLKKLIGIGYLTDEMVQDAPASQTLLETAFLTEYRFMVGNAIFRGKGGGQPLGFINGKGGVVQAIEAGQTIANSNASISKNVSNMLANIPASIWGDVIFLYNQELLTPLVNALIGTSSLPVFMGAGGLSGKPYDTILGRPAFASELCEAQGTPGDLIAIAPSQYHLAEKGGAQIATSLHVRFLNDELAMRITSRLDGKPVWNTTVTPYKGTTARGFFSTLNTRV